MTTGYNSVRWIAILALALMAIVLEATADPVKLGWNERGGVFVDSGASAIQESDIILEQNAKFYKSGAGRLDLPLSKVNSQKPYSLTVLGGTLGLDAGEDATIDVSTPPSACQKASFWVNVTRLLSPAQTLWRNGVMSERRTRRVLRCGMPSHV